MTVSPAYFRELYRGGGDPWNFAESTYEAHKYRVTLGALPRPTYASALELGCSIGVFTEMLAARCSSLLAVDVSKDAIRTAMRRCARLPHVRFATCDLSSGFPRGRFDLGTFCEIGFYFGPRDLRRLIDRIARTIPSGGDVVLVHWTPPVEGHAQTAHDVHECVAADVRFSQIAALREDTFRLDAFRRT